MFLSGGRSFSHSLDHAIKLPSIFVAGVNAASELTPPNQVQSLKACIANAMLNVAQVTRRFKGEQASTKLFMDAFSMAKDANAHQTMAVLASSIWDQCAPLTAMGSGLYSTPVYPASHLSSRSASSPFIEQKRGNSQALPANDVLPADFIAWVAECLSVCSKCE